MENTPLGTLSAVTVDCNHPQELADFYRKVTGWEVSYSDDDYAYLSGGPISLGFQRIADHVRPAWPDPAKQMHLDLRVADLAAAETELVSLGATKPEFQPGGDKWVVLQDPAGHAFCITASD